MMATRQRAGSVAQRQRRPNAASAIRGVRARHRRAAAPTVRATDERERTYKRESVQIKPNFRDELKTSTQLDSSGDCFFRMGNEMMMLKQVCSVSAYDFSLNSDPRSIQSLPAPTRPDARAHCAKSTTDTAMPHVEPSTAVRG
jgi:hypothetical protein